MICRQRYVVDSKTIAAEASSSSAAYLDTEAVARFLARRCSFFSARDIGLLGPSLESLLTSTCDNWLSDRLASIICEALTDVEPKELLHDRTSVALVWKAAGLPKPCLEASITPVFAVQTHVHVFLSGSQRAQTTQSTIADFERFEKSAEPALPSSYVTTGSRMNKCKRPKQCRKLRRG